ncbi:hypothetical protein Pd630_LPD01570 [Rhodococcus opacus PD630]|nr:hypothetical protein Pd630_LPD01570 [Rhodococcus opacus PD630]
MSTGKDDHCGSCEGEREGGGCADRDAGCGVDDGEPPVDWVV